MHITRHRHYTLKNILVSPYSDGKKNLSKATQFHRSCSNRIRHFLAGIILMTPFVNCFAEALFIRNQKKKHEFKKAQEKAKLQKKRPHAKKTARVGNHTLKKTHKKNTVNPPPVRKKLRTHKTKTKSPKKSNHRSRSDSDSTHLTRNKKKPTILLNDIRAEIIRGDRFQTNRVMNDDLLRLLQTDPLAAWKKYLQYQKVKENCKFLVYDNLPPLELINALLNSAEKDEIVNDWPNGFLRDCAILYPELALRCISEDFLWNYLQGGTEEIVDVCLTNSTAAWALIYSRLDVIYRPEVRLSIFKSAYMAIQDDLNNGRYEQDHARNLAVFLAKCTYPVPKEYFDLLSDISNGDNELDAVLAQWTNQGIITKNS